MNPTIGRIVIFKQSENEEPVNGTREHPAIITRVWSEHCVNLQVQWDAAAPSPRTSVLSALSQADGTANERNACWRWPDRS